MKQLLFLLAVFTSFCCFAQQKELLELKIDSVITENLQKSRRQFHLYFHIKNLTGDPLSFFLNPEDLQANAVSSMSNMPFYRLYQDHNLMDISGVFDNWQREGVHTYTEFRGFTDEEYRKFRSENISRNILKLEPHATKLLCVTLSWDKQRYFKEGDLEFYLDEKAKHYIEIAVNLLKEEFSDYLKKDQLEAVTTDHCFIRGWYLSNKAALDFSE